MSVNKGLFLHGWATDNGVWDEVAPEIGFSKGSLIMANLPGHGAEARWLEPSLNPPIISLAGVLSNEEGRVTGFGWSLGAQVLLGLAARFPEKFSALVLVGLTPCFTAKKDFPHAQSRALVRRMIMDMKAAPEDTLKRFYPLNFTEEEQGSEAVVPFMKRYAPPGPIICDAVADGVPQACRMAFNYRDITTGLEALYNTDIRGILGQIKTPTLIIHGSYDKVVPLGAGEFAADNIKGARFEVFPRAGHAPFITQKGRFVEVVRNFLADTGGVF